MPGELDAFLCLEGFLPMVFSPRKENSLRELIVMDIFSIVDKSFGFQLDLDFADDITLLSDDRRKGSRV